MRLIAFALLAAPLSHAAPAVTKIEPPNWWAQHSVNPVRVLIHGSGLKNAKAAGVGVTVSNVKINLAGTYLFADVSVSAPGRHAIRLTTPDGNTSVPFDVLPPPNRTGRFQGFSSDDVIYLIMPDRFANGDPTNDNPGISRGLFDRNKPKHYHGGDLQGVIDRLPYLKDLGVTALWINPIYDNVNHLNLKENGPGKPVTDYHGYGATDFYAVEEHFGTLGAYRQLVDKAHAQGIKVILDMVANHTGPYHPWLDDPPTPTWYHGTSANHTKETWQTWTLMDPHAPASLRASTLDGWFADILPDLNQDDPETARYLIQNTLWWIAVGGLDGIRQDTLPYVPRTFWRDWMKAIKRQYPQFTVVGEMFDGDPALVSFFQGGKTRYDGVDSGVDSLFDFPLYYAVRNVFAGGKPMKDLASSLGHDWLYPHPNALVTFLGLHDVQRFMNERGATPGGLKLAFTFLLTTRGIPMIYYGDELAMRGGEDPDNRRDFPGGWPNDPRDAFTPQGRTAEERDVFDHIRKVANLRSALPDLRRGGLRSLVANDHVYAYSRGGAIVVLNNAPDPESVQIPAPSGVWTDRLGGLGSAPSNGTLRVVMPAKSAAVFSQ